MVSRICKSNQKIIDFVYIKKIRNYIVSLFFDVYLVWMDLQKLEQPFTDFGRLCPGFTETVPAVARWFQSRFARSQASGTMFPVHISIHNHYILPTHPDLWKNIKNSRRKLSLENSQKNQKSSFRFFENFSFLIFRKFLIFRFFQTQFSLWVLNIFS